MPGSLVVQPPRMSIREKWIEILGPTDRPAPRTGASRLRLGQIMNNWEDPMDNFHRQTGF